MSLLKYYSVLLLFWSCAPLSSQHPKGFSLIQENIPNSVLDIKYRTNDNFTGRMVHGYENLAIVLTDPAIKALKSAQEEFNAMGYGIKIFDAYRPQKSVNAFIAWGEDLSDTINQQTYYPDLSKKELFSKGYIAKQSGHSRGSTVDLTLIHLQGKDSLSEVDMGGKYDYFGKRSNVNFDAISRKQKKARTLLRSVMVKHGFVPYEKEWWHFTLKNEPYPTKYFDF
ncbi:MAG: M15 family metallopeptidase [Flavobacteriaceae bacterium]